MEKRSVVLVRVSEKPSETLLRECRHWIALLAGQREWSDTRESWLARAALRCGLPNRTVKSLYYGEIMEPGHPAAIALKNAAERYEIEDLANRFENLAHRLRSILGASRVT